MIDIQTITKIAKKEEIDTNTIYREYVQIRFLQELYRSVPPGVIFFKGGTALRLVFGSERFSEDLDFTIPNNKVQAKTLVRDTVKKMKREFADIDAKELKTPAGYSSKLYLPQVNAPMPLTIKLDFSMRENVLEPQTSPLKNTSLAIDMILVEHLSKSEILAEKFRAITSRKKGRDLYDIWYLLHNNTRVSIPFINKKMAYYRERFDTDTSIKSINMFDEKELFNDLAKFIPKSKRGIIPELKRLVVDLLEATRK
jgi:predicted nucleotidyltransferase component of viral defense system